MPLIINPDLQIVDAEEGAGRVSGAATPTAMSLRDAEVAAAQAGNELGVTQADESTKIAGAKASVAAAKATAPTKFQSPVEKALGRDIGTSVDYAAKIDEQVSAAQASAAKPIMSQEQIDGGGVVKWIGGVNGKWEIVMPIGSPLVGSKAAGLESGRNPAGTKTTAPTGKKEVSRVDNGDGTFTITYDDGTKTIVGTKNTPGGNAKTLISKVDNGDGTFTLNYSDGTSEAIGTKNTTTTQTTDKPTTNVDVLKSALRGLGFTSAILDSSTAFLNSLVKEGLDIDNATEIFLNNKTYTLKNGQTITSPFYAEYGYLNEGLTVPKSANELFNTVEGFKGVVDKYKLSNKYLSQDNLKKYIKNDVTVANLAERAGTAQLRAIEADPFQVNALIKLGYIGSAADLTDFYMDPTIGQQQLELNRQTGVFTAEALRRAKMGVVTSADQITGFKQLTANLASKGYNEAEISKLAGTGFENIAQEIQPLTSFAQIYEKAGGTVEANAALTEDLQKSLLAEEFQGTASERRKRLSEQNIRAFQGTAGTTTSSLRTSGVSGLL